MKVVIFTICKKAVTENGLLSIQGAFSNLLVQSVPARATFSMVTRLLFSSEEEGHFSGYIQLIDPDGQQVLRARIELDVPISDADGTGVFIDSVGEIEITFRKSGEYQFHIAKNGAEPIIIPLYVASKRP